MATFLTADLHFSHANIIKFCNRPFTDVQDMNRSLIRNWNSRVRQKDHVKIVGDFGYLTKEEAREIFNALNGTKELIIGNHDVDRRGNLLQALAELPWTKPPTHYGEVKHDGHRIIISHYAGLTWNASSHGSFQAFGHSHGTLNSLPGSIDVGVDAQNYAPITLDEFVAQARQSLIDAPARIEKIKESLDNLAPRILERAAKIAEKKA